MKVLSKQLNIYRLNKLSTSYLIPFRRARVCIQYDVSLLNRIELVARQASRMMMMNKI